MRNDNLIDFSLLTIRELGEHFQNREWTYSNRSQSVMKRLYEKRLQPTEAAKIVKRFYNIYE